MTRLERTLYWTIMAILAGAALLFAFGAGFFGVWLLT